jgi:predicted porin
MGRSLLIASLMSAVPGAAAALDVALSGHVNREIRYADNGASSDIQQLDNGASRSRIRVRGSQSFGHGMSAGVYLETSVSSNNSARLDLKSRDGGDVAFGIRHSALFFSSEWGTLWFGHTSEAFDGVIEVADRSGTALVDEPFDDHTAAIQWRTSTGAAVSDGSGGDLDVVTVRGDFDGERRDVARYDTPQIGPFSARLNVGDNNTWSVRGLVETQVAGGDFVGALGYLSNDNDADLDAYGLSAGYLHASGLNLHVALARKERGTEQDADFLFIKGGYRWGHNALSASFSRVSDLFGGVDSDRYTLGFVHTLPGPGVELYANWQHYDGLDVAPDVEDINSMVVGTRVSF